MWFMVDDTDLQIGFLLSYYSSFSGRFRLSNLNSIPNHDKDAVPKYPYNNHRSIKNDYVDLYSHYPYNSPLHNNIIWHVILKNSQLKVTHPNENHLQNPLEAPFFLQDRRHVMHVFPDYEQWTVQNWEYLGGYTPDTSLTDVTVDDAVQGTFEETNSNHFQSGDALEVNSGQQAWTSLSGKFGTIQLDDEWALGINGSLKTEAKTDGNAF